MKRLFFILLFLTLIGNVAASGAGAIVIINQNRERQEQLYQDQLKGNGCHPPIEWALNKSCDLKYSYGGYVNKYDCYPYYNIKTDCEGNVISYSSHKITYSSVEAKPRHYILGGAIFGALLLIIYYLKERREK